MSNNRNYPCHCGSGKKFKKCHGNIVYIQQAQTKCKLYQDRIEELQKQLNTAIVDYRDVFDTTLDLIIRENKDGKISG